MNVIFLPQKNQTAIIKVLVSNDDYLEKVDAELKKYRKTAKIPGFRPGMIPLTLLNKMYRKGIVADQTYKLASDAAFDYIKENKLETLGDLMPSKEQKPLDFDANTEYEFCFNIGVAPEMKIELSKKDKVEKIIVSPSQDMIDGYRDNLLRSYGKLEEVDAVEKEEALTITLDNGEMKIEDANISLISFDDDKRKPFIGKKVGDIININIDSLYPDDKQRAAILSIKLEELKNINPEFALEITNIKTFKNPELNDEFFNTTYPNKDITNTQELETHVLEQVQTELNNQIIFKFHDNIRDLIIRKANPTLPAEFMKEWLLAINEGKFTAEQIDEEYPSFENMMQWDLSKRQLNTDFNLKVEEQDVLEEAKNMAASQFKYYGMTNATDEMLDGFAKQILSNKEEAQKIHQRVGELKIFDAVTEKITVKDKTMSVEEFTEMMKKENAKNKANE